MESCKECPIVTINMETDADRPTCMNTETETFMNTETEEENIKTEKEVDLKLIKKEADINFIKTEVYDDFLSENQRRTEENNLSETGTAHWKKIMTK